ncbi:MAG: kelch repeat-containing protein [Thermoplasmata archaeon]
MIKKIVFGCVSLVGQAIFRVILVLGLLFGVIIMFLGGNYLAGLLIIILSFLLPVIWEIGSIRFDRWQNVAFTLAVVFMLVMAVSILYTTNEHRGWTQKTPMPTERGDFAVGAIYGKIYVIGGYVNSESAVNEEYNPLTNKWTKKAPMPTPRRNLAIGVVNGKVYAIGGYSGHNVSGANEEYDPLTDKWTKKAPMPTPREGLAVGVVNDKIYAIGGAFFIWSDDFLTHAEYYSLNQEYDPSTDSWTNKTPMPTGRCDLTIGEVNGKIYALGGIIRASSSMFGRTVWTTANQEYDPIADCWTKKSPILKGTGNWVAGVATNGKIYVISAYTNNEYDPLTDKWTTRAPKYITSYLGGASGVDGKIYVFDESRINEVYDATNAEALVIEDLIGVSLFVCIAIAIIYAIEPEIIKKPIRYILKKRRP